MSLLKSFSRSTSVNNTMDQRGGSSVRGGLSRGGFSKRGASFRGGAHSTGNFRGARRGRGGSTSSYGVPESILEIGRVMHVCEEELVCTCLLTDKVPYFNGRIFLQNKEEIGKIDEIFGPITKCMFSVKMSPNMKATAFKTDSTLFIDGNQLLPLSRFLPKSAAEEKQAKENQAMNKKRRLSFSQGRPAGGRGRGGVASFGRNVRARGSFKRN